MEARAMQQDIHNVTSVKDKQRVPQNGKPQVMQLW